MENQGVVVMKKNQSVVCEFDVGHHGIQQEEELDSVELCLDPLKVAIARLSDNDIRQMRPRELAEVVKFSGELSSRDWFKQLRFMEHDDLIRLAFLARRGCQHEVNAAYQRRGQRIPFVDEL